jgi:DNA polymerase III subunit epsilon
MASELAAQPDYRVLRRLDPKYSGGQPIHVGTTRRAAIVDVETTGMDPKVDQIIELAVIVFEYEAATGQVGPAVGCVSGLEDPGRPIPPEVTAIHGITDDMVKGRRLDEGAVVTTLRNVGLVISHNASFDRPFLEARLAIFSTLPWACSLNDVEWRAHGFTSASLEFLAYRAGFFYEAHRAEVDCRAVLAVLAHAFEDGRPALAELLEHARRPSLRVAALNAGFETKEKLKERGYRWNADTKTWVLDLLEPAKEAELAWLKETIYAGRSVPVEIESIDAKRRYSGRQGHKERLSL